MEKIETRKAIAMWIESWDRGTLEDFVYDYMVDQWKYSELPEEFWQWAESFEVEVDEP